MVVIRGGVVGPDPAQADGLYDNEVQTDRSILFDALGGRQGVFRGFNLATVSGQLALDVSPGSAIALERDGSNIEQARAYYVWSDTITRVGFAAPGVSARRDALIACFVDSEAAGLTSSIGLPVGPHLIALTGNTGTTPMSYSQICSYVGRGGHTRIADVLISPSDTQIIPASFGDRNNRIGRRRTLDLSVQTGFTIQSATYMWVSQYAVEIIVKATKTGATLTATASGNLDPNVQFVADLPAELCPDSTTYDTWNNNGAKSGGWQITSTGQMWLTDMAGGSTLSSGDQFTCRTIYGVPVPAA